MVQCTNERTLHPPPPPKKKKNKNKQVFTGLSMGNVPWDGTTHIRNFHGTRGHMGIPWDGMGRFKSSWDGMGMGREKVSHGQPWELVTTLKNCQKCWIIGFHRFKFLDSRVPPSCVSWFWDTTESSFQIIGLHRVKFLDCRIPPSQISWLSDSTESNFLIVEFHLEFFM